MPNGHSESEDDVIVSYVSDATGLPEAIPIPKDALREALVANPRILVDTLTDLLGNRDLRRIAERAQVPVRPKVPVLPHTTPIEAMLPPDAFGKLSPQAQKLTKQDLLALGGWGTKQVTPTELGLSARDVMQIRDVFSQRIQRPNGGADLSVSCCCCTPCCCASAELEPERSTA